MLTNAAHNDVSIH